MILGDVEETVTTVEIDEETFEEIIKVRAAAGNCSLAAHLLSQRCKRPITGAWSCGGGF